MLVLIEKQKDNQIVEYPLDLLISLTAEPGAVYTIEDTETGEPPEDLVLKKKGETLEIEVDGETVAQVEAFFVPESDTLFSADGSFTPTDHMAVSGDVTEVSGDDSQVVWQADDGDGNALAWTGGLLALAGIGGAVAAAGGGGSSSGESETPSQTTYKLIVSAAAGPFTSDVRVEVYDKDGNLLEASAHNFGADSLKVTLTTGYTGPIFVKVIDANDTDGATPDFRNETGEAVDLSFDLRAMAMADGTGDVYVTVSPLTELAVRAADVDETSFTEASLAYNQYVAEAFGVDDIVGTSPVTTIKSDGTSNPDFNGSDGLSSGEQYGKVLAQLSGADDIDQALTTLSESLVVDEEQGAGFTQDGQILIEESAAEYEEKRDAYQESQGEDLPSFEPDNTPPTVTITDNTDGTATSDVTYTFTFNEAVTGFTADDIDVTGGSKGTFTAVSGTVYTLVVAPDADSTTNITVDVAADVATDAAGNYNSAADQSSQAVDTIAPTVTITDDTTGTATGDVIFTFTFSEAVTGFASDDVDVTGGTKGTFTAISDTVYTLVVTPNDDSTTDITVDVSTDVATDAAGNSNTPATQSVQAVDTTVPDTTAPTVAITDDTAGTATGDVTYTFTFSEAVTGFTADDVDVTGGSKGAFTAVSDSVYTLVVAPDAGSTTDITVDVAADVAVDGAGNSNTAATQSVQAVDTQAPTVAITDDTPGTATGDVTYTFTFSQAVTGFTVDDVGVTGGSKGTFTAVSGTVYTLVVAPDAGSTTDITVDVAADVAVDGAGNSNTAATQSVQAVDTTVPDTTAPTVSITDDTPGTATGDVTYTFTFSEPVTGFTADDVDVTGGSKGAFTAVSGTVYTLVVAPDAGSTTDITVDVAADVAVDGAGNSNTAATQSVQAVDTQAPTVAITDNTAGTATGDVTYTFTFSEAVTGFTADDVDVTGGSKGAFTAVSGTVYTLVVAPDAGSTTDITVDVAADVAVDAAGNSNTAATQSVQAVDTQAPTVAITDNTSGTATGDVTYTFTFSEAVTGFTADDVDVTGGSKGAFTAVSGTVYTLVVAPDAGSTTDITVDVAADVAVDAAGNSNTAATQSVQAVDTQAPTVAITDDTSGTATGDVTYTFTFSEAVTGFTADDVDVTGGSKGAFTAVSGTVYTLVVAPDAGSTTDITVDVAADVAVDGAGNSNTAATQSVQAVDTQAPTVAITDNTSGTATGDVTYTFTFSEAVTGFTADDVDVTGGSKGAFTAVSGTVYTLVVAPDAGSTTDITVDVAADVAVDGAGNSNTAATQSVQAVDTQVPTVAITDNTSGTATGDVTYTFTFSEAVTGFTADDVDVTGGSKGAFTAVSGTVYTLVVAPDAGSTTDITVDVAADVAVDGAGNSNTAATQSVQAVDTQVPTVAITDNTSGTATGDVTYTFTFSEAVTGFTADDVDVTGGSKGAFTAVSGTVYTLVVAPDAGSTTDITVDVAADVAVDAAGNNNTAATQSVQAVDTQVPTVAITDDTSGTATGDVTYTFTFSEAVTGFTADDVDVTGGSKGAFTAVSGTVYTLVVAPDAGSTTDITVDVAADVAVDAAGNSNTAATQSVQAVDTQAPTVAITDDTPGTATGDVTYTFTFSEAVTGFTADDVDVTGGSKGAFTAVSDSVYTLVVAPDAGSTTDITVDVAADVAVDAAGNSNTAATQSVQAVDTQVPTVAITDDTPGTATGDVTYTFTFSEAVTGFTADDVDVTGGSKDAFTAVSDSVYTLVVAPDAGSTTDITVDVAADVVVDGAGNSNTAATQSVQAVDTQAPTVAITDDTPGTATGDVTYTFTFSESVTGFTTDDVDVTGGSKGAFTAVSDSVYTLVVAPDASSTTDITVDVAADVAVDGAGNSNTAATQSVQAVDTTTTAFTGNYAVVTSAGIFADENNDHVKDGDETNELTGTELSTWLSDGDRTIVFNDAPDIPINLSGFTSGDKIGLTVDFYDAVFETTNVSPNSFRHITTNDSNTFYWSTSIYFMGVGISKETTKLYYGYGATLTLENYQSGTLAYGLTTYGWISSSAVQLV